METKKITPWANWNEWKSVVDDAYNDTYDIAAYRRALSCITAWQAREQNLPSGLLCLKELIIARLAKLSMTQDTIESVITYQSSVALHVVRFVNFITEPYQTNIHAKTIKKIAGTIGIPDWIVNIRHSATHFTLPSVEVLEEAIDFLFDYLQERYCNTYKETSLEQSILQNVKAYIENVFTDYMNARYKLTLMKQKNKKLADVSGELEEKIESVAANFRNETFEILLQDGFIIPTNEQLNAMGVVGEELMEVENLSMPKSFLNIWSKFLVYCNENNLMGFFFKQLIDAYKFEVENVLLSNQENLRNKFLLSWIVYLLRSNSFKNEKLKNSKFQFHFTYKQVLLDILSSNPNHFTLLFLKEISKIPSFTSEMDPVDFEKIKQLVNFLNMTNQIEISGDQEVYEESNEMDMDENQSFYDLSIFEKPMNTMKNKTDFFNTYQSNRNARSSGDWELIDDENWNCENLKLGFVENQSCLNFNLDICQLIESSRDDGHLNGSVNQSIQEYLPLSGIDKFFSSEYTKSTERSMQQKIMNSYWEFA